MTQIWSLRRIERSTSGCRLVDHKRWGDTGVELLIDAVDGGRDLYGISANGGLYRVDSSTLNADPSGSNNCDVKGSQSLQGLLDRSRCVLRFAGRSDNVRTVPTSRCCLERPRMGKCMPSPTKVICLPSLGVHQSTGVVGVVIVWPLAITLARHGKSEMILGMVSQNFNNSRR